MKKVPAKARAHSSAMSYRPSSRPGSGTPNSRLNSAWWFSDQRRNPWQAATILTVSFVAWSGSSAAAPAAWMAWWMSEPSSVKMFAQTCLSSSSWLSKYRYSPGAVIPISRAMARSVTASGPLWTSSRRAVWMISSEVAARSRSRRDGGCPAPGSVPTSAACVTAASRTRSHRQEPLPALPS